MKQQQTYGQFLNQLEEFYPLSVIALYGRHLMQCYRLKYDIQHTIRHLEILRNNGATLERIEIEYVDKDFNKMIMSLQPSDTSNSND